MRRLTNSVIGLYPRVWRDRYGEAGRLPLPEMCPPPPEVLSTDADAVRTLMPGVSDDVVTRRSSRGRGCSAP